MDKLVIASIYEARRRKLVYVLFISFVETCALGVSLMTLFILLDAVAGFGLSFRLKARILVLAVSCLYLFLSIVFRKKELALDEIIAEVEQIWPQSFSHDVLRNAWKLIPRAMTGFALELKNKEIARAREALINFKKDIASTYSLKRALFRIGAPRLCALVLCPVMLLGLSNPSYQIARLLKPSSEFAFLADAIEIEPLPGIYEVPYGNSFLIKARLKIPKPVSWKNPVIKVNGENYSLTPLAGAREGYVFSVPRVIESLTLSFSWEDFESKPWSVVPRKAPELSRFKVTVFPPAYTKEKTETFEKPSSISLWKGSRVELESQADRPLRKLEFYLQEGENNLARIGPVFVANEPGKLEVHVEDNDGRVNASAWALNLDVREDRPPTVNIVEPAFKQVQMDIDETLPIFWEAQDDLALLEIHARLEGISSAHIAGKKLIWKVTEETVKNHKDSFVFKPKEWGLKSGDVAQLELEAQDNFPERAAGVSVSEALVIAVTDFRGIHEDSVANAHKKIEDEMIAHLQSGLKLQSKLKNNSDEAVQKDFPSYQKEAEALTRRVESYREASQKDPLANPRFNWSLKNLEATLRDAQKTHLANAKAAGAKKDTQAMEHSFERYLEELQKSVSAFGELRKEQKVFDAIDNAGRMESLLENLDSQMSQSPSLSDLREALADLDRELSELSKTLSKMSPDVLPQEFINQIREADVPMTKLGQTRQELNDAIAKGDTARARQLVKEMLEAVRNLRKTLNEANKAYQQVSEKIPNLEDKLDKLISGQRGILDKTSAVDMDLRSRRDKAGPQDSLSDTDKLKLGKLGRDQQTLGQDALGLLEVLAGLDRSYPTLLLGSKVIGLEAAHARQEGARKALLGFDLALSLDEESGALKALETLRDDLKDLSKNLNSMPMSGSASGEGQPLILIPQPAGGTSGAPGAGFRLGQVVIPNREDYKANPKNREEILKSLQEKMPKEDKPDVERYLENLLK